MTAPDAALTGRPRRFPNDLCVDCQTRPRRRGSYCRFCHRRRRTESRLRTKIKGHEHYAWQPSRLLP